MTPRPGPFLSALLAVGAVASCASPSKQVEAPPPRVPVDYPVRYPEADAVVLSELQDVELRYSPNGDIYSIVTVEARKKLLKNLDEHANVEFVVHAGDELLEMSARTHRPSGDVIEVDSDDVQHRSGHRDRTDSFADFETYWFTFPGVERGCEIEYEYRVRVGQEYHRGQWLIQEDIPKERSEFRIAIPRNLLKEHGWTWRFEAYNAPFLGMPERLERDISEQAGTRHKSVYRWVAHDIPAFEPDERMPPPREYVARVEVAPGLWKSWRDPASDFRRRFFGPEVRKEHWATEALARKLTDGADGDEARIRRLHDHVRGIRTVPVSLEDGGLRPNPPMKVVERGYGDCKDQATLLVALLHAVEIPAYPALVRTASSGRIDPDFVSFDFDHMIVRVEPKDAAASWIDPTSPSCPPGRLPWEVQGVDALVVHEDGGMLERTPLDLPQDNRLNATVYLTVDAEGGARGRAEVRFGGMDAIRVRDALHEATSGELVDRCESWLSSAWESAEISEVRIGHREDLAQDLVVSFELDVTGAIRLQRDLAFVRPEVLRLLDWVPRNLDLERTYPLAFPYPREISVEVVVEVSPESWRADTFPEDVDVKAGGLEYRRRSWDRTDEHLVYQTTFRLGTTHIGPADWPSAHAFFDEVDRVRGEDIILARAR